MKKCPLKHFGGHLLKKLPAMRALFRFLLARLARAAFNLVRVPRSRQPHETVFACYGLHYPENRPGIPDFFLELSPPRAICQVDTSREYVTRLSPARSITNHSAATSWLA